MSFLKNTLGLTLVSTAILASGCASETYKGDAWYAKTQVNQSALIDPHYEDNNRPLHSDPTDTVKYADSSSEPITGPDNREASAIPFRHIAINPHTPVFGNHGVGGVYYVPEPIKAPVR